MKFHKSPIMKWFSVVLLIGCVGIKWYFNEHTELPMEYLWPVHVLLIVVGFVMVFGMLSDQKNIDSLIASKLGEGSTLTKIRNRAVSGLVSVPVLLITMLPAFGFMGSSLEEAVASQEVEVVFANGWLLFAIAIFSYFIVAQPTVNYVHQKLANQAFNRTP